MTILHRAMNVCNLQEDLWASPSCTAPMYATPTECHQLYQDGPTYINKGLFCYTMTVIKAVLFHAKAVSPWHIPGVIPPYIMPGMVSTMPGLPSTTQYQEYTVPFQDCYGSDEDRSRQAMPRMSLIKYKEPLFTILGLLYNCPLAN